MAITLVIFAAVQFADAKLRAPAPHPACAGTAPFNANAANEIMISSAGETAANNTMTVVGDFSQPGAWMLSNKPYYHPERRFQGRRWQHAPDNSTPTAVQQLAGQPPFAPGGELPTGEQVLAAPAHRDRNLSRHRRRTRLALRLAGPPSARMTSALAGRNSP